MAKGSKPARTETRKGGSHGKRRMSQGGEEKGGNVGRRDERSAKVPSGHRKENGKSKIISMGKKRGTKGPRSTRQRHAKSEVVMDRL